MIEYMDLLPKSFTTKGIAAIIILSGIAVFELCFLLYGLTPFDATGTAFYACAGYVGR